MCGKMYICVLIMCGKMYKYYAKGYFTEIYRMEELF